MAAAAAAALDEGDEAHAAAAAAAGADPYGALAAEGGPVLLSTGSGSVPASATAGMLAAICIRSGARQAVKSQLSLGVLAAICIR